MKLRSLYLDRMVVIPGAGHPGGPPDLREQSFHASDGWTVRWLGEDAFSIQREGMPEPVYVRGVGASYLAERAVAVVEPAPMPMPADLASGTPAKKGNKR